MVIRKKDIEILKNIKNGQKLNHSDEDAYILELEDLLSYSTDGNYKLTYSGEAILNLFESIEKNGIDVSNWKDEFRFIGSEIIAMIDSSIKAGGKVFEDFEKPLKERGFAKDGKLTDEAYELWEIYRLARPQLTIDRELADHIKSLPQGPAKRTGIINADDKLTRRLEAQRLIAFSMPPSNFFAFTGLGRKIRDAILKGSQPFSTVVNLDILLSIKKARENPAQLSDSEKEILLAMAYIDEHNRLLAAGEDLYMAYKLYSEGAILLTPSIALILEEIETLFVVDELWQKHKTNKDIIPTQKQIKEALAKKDEEISQHTAKILYALECFGLISSRKDDRNRLIYHITGWGRKVLEDQKAKKREISSPAVKCLTITRKEFSAPGNDWYEEAKKANLVGDFGPTKSGSMYEELAISIDRLTHITDFEMEILSKISDKNPIYLKEYQQKYNSKDHEKVKKAIELLDAKGFVEILPTGIVILTEAGVYLKKALSGVSSGFGNPVTPHLVRVLRAIKEVGTLYEKEKKIRVRPDKWKEVEKLSGLDPETFGEVIRIARLARFIGTNSLTDAGYNLLCAIDELKKSYSELSRWFFN
ncbi:DUF505 domain-containing protein [Hippea jasoniae]|uniref:DUF505 domain-containing protein n=1 Tax=Hippea jasoniae TaxID=944479 RepID=UPI00069116A6|nr:DUF505 domain-containing protein [Hippea jasoniae]